MGPFRDVVRLFKETRLSAMNLRDPNETSLLLRACEETLQMLQLHHFDPPGEHLSPKSTTSHNSVTKSSLMDFDLSRNRPLGALEVPMTSIDHALRNGSLDAASRLCACGWLGVQPGARGANIERAVAEKLV